MGVHALYTAATGMDGQLRNIDVIANNIANINTSGFRRDRVNFSDLFYRQQALAGSTGIGPNPRPSGIHIGHGVRVVSTEKMFESTPPRITNNPTDVAISSSSGDNLFFQIETPNGDTAYTRAGNFTVAGNQRMSMPNGYALAGVDNVPENASVQVLATGQVMARVGTQEPTQIGQITLTRFINPAGLTPRGDNLFYATSAAGQPQDVNPAEDDTVSVIGGALEGSNVSAIKELIQLIQAQRAYEINSNVIQTSDEAMQIANNLRG